MDNSLREGFLWLVDSLLFLFIIEYLTSRFFASRIKRRQWLRPYLSIPAGLLIWGLGLSMILDFPFSLTYLEVHKSVRTYLNDLPFLSGDQKRMMVLYENVMPAVVRIDTQDSRGDDASLGTGFFIDANGTLVTNRHVLKDKAKAYAVTEDRKRYENHERH